MLPGQRIFGMHKTRHVADEKCPMKEAESSIREQSILVLRGCLKYVRRASYHQDAEASNPTVADMQSG